jgi:urea transport system substrate-binding protein
VYAIGETPSEQLRPAIHALAKRFRLTRWALLGNDYVWPRISHTLAKGYIRETGGQVVDDLYLPLGIGDFGPVLERLARLKADALLLSLIGQDAIAFNREFGSAPSRTRGLVRLSCAIEENELLAIGTGNTEGLYATAGYFASTPTDANMAFKERYYSVLGEHAPTLNTLGQSTYEGVQFLAALVQQAHSQRKPWQAADIKPICYRSARETAYLDNRRKTSPMYLARAEGHLLQVIERL